MFKDLGSMMEQVQKMGEKMKASQQALAGKTVNASAGAGLVKITFNGKMEALSISVSPEAVDKENIAALEDLILSAVNIGIARAKEEMQQVMREATGGLPLPNIF